MYCTQSCTDGYVYFAANKSCLAAAPFGYVTINGVAEKCSTSCQTCGPTQDVCLTCGGNLYLYQSSCGLSTTCPGGTVPISNKCQPCALTCATCSSSTTKCDSCNAPLYLNGNNCQ